MLRPLGKTVRTLSSQSRSSTPLPASLDKVSDQIILDCFQWDKTIQGFNFLPAIHTVNQPITSCWGKHNHLSSHLCLLQMAPVAGIGSPSSLWGQVTSTPHWVSHTCPVSFPALLKRKPSKQKPLYMFAYLWLIYFVIYIFLFH